MPAKSLRITRTATASGSARNELDAEGSLKKVKQIADDVCKHLSERELHTLIPFVMDAAITESDYITESNPDYSDLDIGRALCVESLHAAHIAAAANKPSKSAEIHDVVTLAIKRLMTLKDLESVAELSKAAIGRDNIDLCEPDAVNVLANLIVSAMSAITE